MCQQNNRKCTSCRNCPLAGVPRDGLQVVDVRRITDEQAMTAGAAACPNNPGGALLVGREQAGDIDAGEKDRLTRLRNIGAI